MLRTFLVTSMLLGLATPAAAQGTPLVPPGYTTAPADAPAAAPAPAAEPGRASGSSGYTAASRESVSYSTFPPRDRHGRMLLGTRHERQDDRGLWGAGLGLFLAGWVTDILGTAIFNAVSHDRDGAQEEDAMAWSIVPWVGPIIQLGLEAPHPALPIMSGLLQIAGTVMFAVGLTSHHDAEVPIYGWPTAHLEFDVTPTDGGAFATVTLHAM